MLLSINRYLYIIINIICLIYDCVNIVITVLRKLVIAEIIRDEHFTVQFAFNCHNLLA